MGQVLRRIAAGQQSLQEDVERKKNVLISKRTPDLSALPPELGLLILSHLNATDLCLAGCVWQNLADVEILWHG